MPRSADARPLPMLLLARLSDERLVKLVRRGNEFAFEELFERHSEGVRAFCSRLLSSREEGEDARQHAFLAVYRAIRERDVEPQAFKPWLYTIARNRCLSVLRSPSDAALLEDQPSFVASGLTADRVEQQAEVRELLSDVRDLPELQRAALLLFEVADLSHAEIAQVIDCPRAKVKSLVFQARASLTVGREARETPCSRIREQLEGLPGSRLPLSLRRHLKDCEGCSDFARAVRKRRRRMTIGLPLAPSIGLKRSLLGAAAGGSGGGGGTLAGGVAAGIAGGGFSALVGTKAGLLVAATAGATALGVVGGGLVEQPRRPQDSKRGTPSRQARASSPTIQASSGDALALPRDDRGHDGSEARQHRDSGLRQSPQPATRTPPAARPLSTPTRKGGRAKPPPGPPDTGSEDARGRQPKRDHHARRPKSDHGAGVRKPDRGARAPERGRRGPGMVLDLAAVTCENHGGVFMDVSQHAYSCTFRSSSRSQAREKARRTCERSAGSFVDVSPTVYACVLPGGTLPNSLPVLPGERTPRGQRDVTTRGSRGAVVRPPPG